MCQAWPRELSRETKDALREANLAFTPRYSRPARPDPVALFLVALTVASSILYLLRA